MYVTDLLGKNINVTDLDAAIKQEEMCVTLSKKSAKNPDAAVRYYGEDAEGRNITLVEYHENLLEQLLNLKS